MKIITEKKSLQKKLNLIFFILIIGLALLAGFYQASYQTEIKKYNRLEDKYIRVKMIIGEEKFNEAIENSYQYVDKNGQIIKEINF